MALIFDKKNNRQTPRIRRQVILSTFGRFSGFLAAALAAKTKHLVRDGAKIRRRSLWDVRATFLALGRVLQDNRVGIIVHGSYSPRFLVRLCFSWPTISFPHGGRGCAPPLPHPPLRSRSRQVLVSSWVVLVISWWKYEQWVRGRICALPQNRAAC